MAIPRPSELMISQQEDENEVAARIAKIEVAIKDAIANTLSGKYRGQTLCLPEELLGDDKVIIEMIRDKFSKAGWVITRGRGGHSGGGDGSTWWEFNAK